MSKVQVDKVVNLSDDGAPQLTYGAELPVGYGLTGAGGLNITGVVTAASAVFSGNVTIGGTLTYEDVTNIDVVGVSTFAGRMNVNSSALFNEGLSVTAGVTTIAGTSTFAKATTVNATLTASEGIHVSAGVATFAGAVSTGALTVTGATNVNSGHVNVDAGYSFQWGDSHERIEQSDGNIEFFTANGEKMRLAGSNLGIGITNPDTILHIKAANPYATIQASSDGGECGVHFEDDDGNVDGKITYRTDYTGNTDNYLRFYTAQTNALEINSDQEVLPQSHLRIKDSKALYLGNSNDFTLWHDATDCRIRYNHSVGSLKFQQNDNSTVAMFDASGRLLQGLTTSRGNYGNNTSGVDYIRQIEGTNATSSTLSLVRNSADANDGGIVIGKTRNASAGGNTVVQAGDDLGTITWAGNDGTTMQFGAEITSTVETGVGNDDMPAALKFKTNSGTTSTTERLRITAAGEVTMGNYFTANQIGDVNAALQVQGTSAADSSISINRWSNDTGGGILQFFKSRGTSGGAVDKATDGDAIGQIRFVQANNNELVQGNSARIDCNVDAAPGGGDYPARLSFWTCADGSSTVTERMRITKDGDFFYRNGAGYSIFPTAGNTSTKCGFQFKQTAGNNRGFALLEERGDSNCMDFIIAKSRDTNGTGGIGEINSGDTLGNIRFCGADDTRQVDAATISVWNTGTVATDRVAGRMAFYTHPDSTSGTSSRMVIDESGNIGAPTQGTNIYNASDERVKENMVELTDGLSKIKQLKPISFNWIHNFCESENGITQYGFGAQTTQAVDELLVQPFGEGDIEFNNQVIKDPLRVNEKFIIPLLVKAIQEQQEQIETLKARLDAAGL